MKVAYKDWSKAFENFNDTVVACLKSGDVGIPMEIKLYVPYQEYVEMVSDIASLCMNGNRFYPAMFDIALYLCVLKTYTNLNCDVTLEHISELLSKTDVVNTVQAYVDIEKIKRDAHNEIVERQKIAAAETEVEKLCRNISVFIDSMVSLAGDSSMEDVEKLLGAVADIDKQDINDIIRERVHMKIVGDSE